MRFSTTLTLLAMLAIGCAGANGDDSDHLGETSEALTTRTLSITVPAGVRPATLAVSASDTFKVSDRAALRILAGGYPLAASLGTSTLEVGADSNTGSLRARGNVFLRERGHVNGDLTTSGRLTRQNNTFITGALSELASVPSKTWSRNVTFADVTQGAVNLEPDQTRTLSPGTYGALTVKSRAKLYLSSGSYYFSSFGTEPQSKIYLNKSQGGIYIYVSSSAFLRNSWVDNGGSAADLLFAYFGTSSLTVESPLAGTIIAPTAQVDLREVGSAGHTGAVFAKRMDLNSQATLWHSAMPSGLWGDGDPCSFGLLQGDSCSTKAACPINGSKSCGQEVCGCVAPAGQAVECLVETTSSSGDSRYMPAAAGAACRGPGGAGSCNVDGYCIVRDKHASDNSDCTTDASVGSGNYDHVPLPDGSGCSNSPCGQADPEPSCQSGYCICATALEDDGNECTSDSCSGGTCTHAPNTARTDLKCARGDCIGICSATGVCECDDVEPVPDGAPLRILTANVAALTNTYGIKVPTLGFADCPTNWLGESDYHCLANRLADKVLQSNYDVVVFNEAFDESYKDKIFERLHGEAADGKFPYVLRRLNSDGWLGITDPFDDSGLMMFSKWPFDRKVGNEDGCFDGEASVDVRGSETETVLVPDPSNEVMSEYTVNKSAYGFRRYGWDTESSDDTLANKGIGFARLVAPTGIKYDVFFSHLQAYYGGDDYDQYLERIKNRKDQLRIAQDLMECLHGIGGADAIVLAGDLNINGDISNDYWDKDDEGALKGDGYAEKQRHNNRYEWDHFFNINAGGNSFFKTTLLDSWANAMSKPECLPNFAGGPAAGCGVTGDDAPYTGLTTYDRGFSWGNQESEERLDYIVFGSKGTRDATHRFGDFGPQHISKAYNIWKGNDYEGGITKLADDNGPLPKLGGSQILSDHIGLNGEIDYATPHSNPADAFPIEDPSGGLFEMQLERRGVAQWFRIEEPGSYVFSVNPASHLPALPDNGITYRVYTADELSKPAVPHKGEVLEVPPGQICYAGTGEHRTCYERPGYREAKFKAINFPLFIKVFHASSSYPADYTGRYLFMFERVPCTSQDQACDLVPFEELDSNVELHTHERWFAFHVDIPDAGNQALDLSVTETDPSEDEALFSAEVMDHDGNPVMKPGNVPLVLAASTDSSGRKVWSLSDHGGLLERKSDLFFGGKFFLKLTSNPAVTDAVPFSVRLTTNLTWLYGPDLGGAEGHVRCNNTQEVGEDEIWMYGIASGADIGFPHDATGVQLSGGIDEDEHTEWTKPYFRGFPTPSPRPRAALFTGDFTLRFFEDDPVHDETADRKFHALENVVGPRLAPGGWWNFPEYFFNDGENYEGKGPTLSHYLDGQVCKTNADCTAPLICGGSLCVRP
jgi:hypothetical protein